MKGGLGRDSELRTPFLSIGGLDVLFRGCALILRFIPGRIGSNRGRLRHIGWEKCCHGLTCRPRESSEEGFLSDLLGLLGYPSGSGAALLERDPYVQVSNSPFC